MQVIQTSALGFGGYTDTPGSGEVFNGLTESYNGTNWTVVNTLGYGKTYNLAGSGSTNTAALRFWWLCIGITKTAETETLEWN